MDLSPPEVSSQFRNNEADQSKYLKTVLITSVESQLSESGAYKCLADSNGRDPKRISIASEIDKKWSRAERDREYRRRRKVKNTCLPFIILPVVYRRKLGLHPSSLKDNFGKLEKFELTIEVSIRNSIV